MELENVVDIKVELEETDSLKVEMKEAGPPGPKGEPGYTPIKGIDYWTEEDIDEIKSYIDENGGGGVTSWNDLKDKPFGDIENKTYLIPEGTLANSENIEFNKLEYEQEYLVTYNGVEYRCTAFRYDLDGWEYNTYIGNLSLVRSGLKVTDYPFCIVNYPFDYASNRYLIKTIDEDAVISVSQISSYTKQIDTKFLPDTIVDVNYLKNNKYATTEDVTKYINEQDYPDKKYVDDTVTQYVDDKVEKKVVSYIELTEQPFGDMEIVAVLFPKNTLVQNYYGYYPSDFGLVYENLIENEKYLIVVNGIKYVCEAIKYDRIDEIIVGNPNLYYSNFEANEYPFAIVHDEELQCYYLYFDEDIIGNEAVINVSRLNTEIRKIDAKFLPDTVATTEYVDNLIGAINTELASLTTLGGE